jgi:hypothetical protein
VSIDIGSSPPDEKKRAIKNASSSPEGTRSVKLSWYHPCSDPLPDIQITAERSLKCRIRASIAMKKVWKQSTF